MVDWPITDNEADYARALYARFQLLTRWEAQKDGGAPVLVDRTGPNGGPRRWGRGSRARPRSARLARADDRLADLRDDTFESTACGAGVLAQRQREASDPRVAGAWFTDDESRMDDQQHAISGLLGLADLLDARAKDADR